MLWDQLLQAERRPSNVPIEKRQVQLDILAFLEVSHSNDEKAIAGVDFVVRESFAVSTHGEGQQTLIDNRHTAEKFISSRSKASIKRVSYFRP